VSVRWLTSTTPSGSSLTTRALSPYSAAIEATVAESPSTDRYRSVVSSVGETRPTSDTVPFAASAARARNDDGTSKVNST
jgi:hypothetical protein